MKILLIDVDSKIPNLALMKISAYHKSIGDNVSFLNCDEPDIIYASVIFKKNKYKVDGLKFIYPNAEINIGGSGYDLNKKLPGEIEYMKPDYSLYPECDYSMGFSTRGCIRKCKFCIVNEKEGSFKVVQHPSEWHNIEFKKIDFLDNNILADKKWFIKVANWCIDNNLKVHFHGLDIRLLNIEIAEMLLKLKFFKCIVFAWDNVKDESVIKQKIYMLRDVGFTDSTLKQLVQFYVYVDSDNEYDSGVYRCRELKKLSCNAFVMYNIDKKPTKRIQDLRRWANRKWIYWSCDISDYKH